MNNEMNEREMIRTVMNRVVKWEESRLFWKLARVSLAILGLFLLMLVAAWVGGVKIQERKTAELFEIFKEDREIINEFSREVLNTVWWELPRRELLGGLVAIGGLVWLVMWWERRGEVVRQKLEQVLKYEKQKEKDE